MLHQVTITLDTSARHCWLRLNLDDHDARTRHDDEIVLASVSARSLSAARQIYARARVAFKRLNESSEWINRKLRVKSKGIILGASIPPVHELQASLSVALSVLDCRDSIESFDAFMITEQALYATLAVNVAALLRPRIASFIAALRRAKRVDEWAFEANRALCAYLRRRGCCAVDARGWLY